MPGHSLHGALGMDLNVATPLWRATTGEVATIPEKARALRRLRGHRPASEHVECTGLRVRQDMETTIQKARLHRGQALPGCQPQSRLSDPAGGPQERWPGSRATAVGGYRRVSATGTGVPCR